MLNGARPVFVDVDEASLNMDPDLVERAPIGDVVAAVRGFVSPGRG